MYVNDFNNISYKMSQVPEAFRIINKIYNNF